jgi:hypothetical protein
MTRGDRVMSGEAPNKILYPYERYIYEWVNAGNINKAIKEFHHDDFSMFLYMGNIWDSKLAYESGLLDSLNPIDIKDLKSAYVIVSMNSKSNTFDVLKCSSKLDAKKNWNVIAYNRPRWLSWW